MYVWMQSNFIVFFIFTGLMEGSRQIQTGALGTWFGIIWSVCPGITNKHSGQSEEVRPEEQWG